ncbi:hypothetical protein GCM10010520_68250 [Rhizobium viscosum]|uniref:Membrane protein implicated in regulation of membrane protease activity n=1 Tax=Rhizobium viscosum TaxID=1673 RepID=A0ABR9ITZ8_RHIVS|nr:hypothetical protein [Rhizobium viscosum]MBE1506666.1 membrane protein implicated in regulation of membrane protease activity [Rhizobium viscosum]
MWEMIKELAQTLFGNIIALLLVAGFFLLILGASGGITYGYLLPISNVYARGALIFLGVVLIAVAVALHVFAGRYASGVDKRIDPKSFGIEITHPKNGDFVDVFNVDGNIKKQIPPGYKMILLEFYPSDGGFRPVGHISVDMDKNTWRAEGIEIYGRGEQKRRICVYLVGRTGMILLEYFRGAAKIHYKTIEALKAARAASNLDPDTAVQWLPLIPLTTPDMLECHHVSVTKKT